MSKVLVLQRVVAAVLAIAALAAGLGLIGLSVAYMLGSVVGMVGSFWSIRRMGLRVDLSSEDEGRPAALQLIAARAGLSMAGM